jgi:microcystin-dependent protein
MISLIKMFSLTDSNHKRDVFNNNKQNHKLMKKISTLVFSLFLIFVFNETVLAQVTFSFLDTKGISFQGYARNPSGGALASQSIEINFTIYPVGDEAGAVMTETHTSTTDPFGVFGVQVGAISTTQFRAINFGKANYWLKVETRPSASGTFAVINNSELLSTPYAKFANNGNPVGTVISFAGPKANLPAGYLICDGTSYNTADYPNLFAAIATSWGSTSSATFNVPDMRGMFLRGQADGQSSDPDRTTRGTSKTGGASADAVGSYQGDVYGSHNHGSSGLSTNTTGIHDHGLGKSGLQRSGLNVYGVLKITGFQTVVATDDDTANNQANVSQIFDLPPSTNSNHGDHSHSISGSVALNGGPESRPKNVSVLYLIKY